MGFLIFHIQNETKQIQGSKPRKAKNDEVLEKPRKKRKTKREKCPSVTQKT